MRGKLVAAQRGKPRRLGSPGWSGHFGPWSYDWNGCPVHALWEKYGHVFGIAQLDVHRLQSPPSSDMDTTCHTTAIVVNVTRTWR
jgi:hypothetical protein